MAIRSQNPAPSIPRTASRPRARAWRVGMWLCTLCSLEGAGCGSSGATSGQAASTGDDGGLRDSAAQLVPEGGMETPKLVSASSASSASDGGSGHGASLPDTTPPTIPTGLTGVSTALGSSGQATNTLSFDFPSDPYLPFHRHTGVGQCNVLRDGAAYATVPVSSPGLTNVFASSDIGAVGIAGSSVQAPDGTDWTVSGAGADIYGTSDAFQFVEVGLAGNGAIVARLTAMAGPSSPAEPKAGIMFRASLASQDAFVLLGYQAGNVTLQSRAASGDTVAVASYTPATLPLWMKLTRTGNAFAASTSTDGNAWTAQASVNVAMAATTDVGLAVTSQVKGALATATFDQVNVEDEPRLTFSDPNIPASTTHVYAVSCEDLASPPNVSAPGAAVSVTTGAAGGGTTSLLSYLEGLPTGTANRMLSGQHSNYWDANPLDQFAGSMPDVTIGSTGLTPAILGTTLSAHDIPNYGLQNSAEDGVSLSNAWLAAGGIVHLSLWPGNPQTLSGNQADLTLSASELLTPGSSSSDNWHSYLASVVTKLKQLQAPVLFRPFVELNGGWFWWGPENFTAAQFIQLWQEMHDYLVSEGVTNVLWVYNVNTGAGNYTSYYPGADYVDVVSMDAYPPSSSDAAMYAALKTLGKPVMYSEVGCASDPGDFTCDNGTLLATVEATCPDVAATIIWSQNWALSEQNDAVGFLGNSWIVNRPDVPSGL